MKDFFFFFFFFDYTHGVRKFSGYGSNLYHVSSQSHYSGNTGYLTFWASQELLKESLSRQGRSHNPEEKENIIFKNSSIHLFFFHFGHLQLLWLDKEAEQKTASQILNQLTKMAWEELEEPNWEKRELWRNEVTFGVHFPSSLNQVHLCKKGWKIKKLEGKCWWELKHSRVLTNLEC